MGFRQDPPFLQLPRIPSIHHLLSTGSWTAKMFQNRSRDSPNMSCSGNMSSFNITNCANRTIWFNDGWSHTRTSDHDRSHILSWLSPLEPELRHRDIQERRVENIGEWVLQTEEFKSWYAGSGGSESDNRVLFCYGDPGVGKT